MKILTLTQRESTAQRLDMSAFTPERLADLTPAQIGRLPLYVGNRKEQAGELFQIDGVPGEYLTIVSSARNLDNLGDRMSHGELRVEGHGGRCTGRALCGGSLLVEGSTGDEAGVGMSAGWLRIAGDTGERLGGPMVGAQKGMSGGLIQVEGNADDRAGERLRRGTIVIGGDAGDYCGANMIAGTLAVCGRVGAMVGSGMRRGTLLLNHPPRALPATFNDNGAQELGFLALLLRGLADLGDLSAWTSNRRLIARRFVGDIGEGGQGEILWPVGDLVPWGTVQRQAAQDA